LIGPSKEHQEDSLPTEGKNRFGQKMPKTRVLFGIGKQSSAKPIRCSGFAIPNPTVSDL
jgi:hypothetical protein